MFAVSPSAGRAAAAERSAAAGEAAAAAIATAKAATTAETSIASRGSRLPWTNDSAHAANNLAAITE